MHNLLIASTASPHREFWFGFHRQLRFSIFTHVWVFLCLNMFYFYVTCFCHDFIPACSHRLSREIRQHIFVLWLPHNLLFAWPASPHRHFCLRFYRQLHFCKFIYVWVWKLLNKVHSYVSFICNVSIPVCSHRLIRATMDRHPKRSIPSSWWARAVQIVICLLAHIHVCLIQFRLHPQVNSTEMKTYFHTPTMALRLHS